MKTFLLILCVLFVQQAANSQIDTSAVTDESQEIINIRKSLRFNKEYYTITDEEFSCLKRVIQEDVINWPENMNDTVGNLWPKMSAQYTSVYVTIDLDSIQYELDVIAEYKRRILGGFAGSFPFAITWNFDVSEKTLIAAINELTEENPNLIVSNDPDLINGKNSYWYYMNLFDKTNNETIQIWTRNNMTEPASTSLALVGYIKQGDSYSEQQLINQDFWKKENDNRIKYFQLTVVDKLNVILTPE